MNERRINEKTSYKREDEGEEVVGESEEEEEYAVTKKEATNLTEQPKQKKEQWKGLKEEE